MTLTRIIFLIICSYPLILFSQRDSTLLISKIVLKDNTKFFGVYQYQSGDTIFFKTNFSDNFYFIKENAKIIDTRICKIRNGKYWELNQMANQYIVSPGGYSLPKNKFQYTNSCLFINKFDYGITNQLSAGLYFIPYFGLDEVPISFHLKFSMPIIKNKLQFSIGGITAAYPELFRSYKKKTLEYAGTAAYGSITIGNKEQNFTLLSAINFPYTKNENNNVFSFMNMNRISKRLYFLSEFHVWKRTRTLTLLSHGSTTGNKYKDIDFEINAFPSIRLKWYSISLDFGCLIPGLINQIDDAIPFFVISYMKNSNRKRFK